MLYQSLRAAAHVALRWYYAEVVVQGGERVPPRGPLLVVANHPNALVDALLVSTTLRRRVMLTAKATLFEHPILAPLLTAVGVVPLRRAADERARGRSSGAGSDGARNSDAFGQVRAALAAGRAVLVFPEGISHDRPTLAPLKTGAARMALDAHAAGVRALQLLPVGLVFEAKERLRSRVLVRVGQPIALDEWLAAEPAADAARLTAQLDDALRRVTLNFASDARATRAVSLARALAMIGDAPPSLAQPRSLASESALAERVELAIDALAEAPTALAQQADRFSARVSALEDRLAASNATLANVQISSRIRHAARFLVREGGLALLALPVALLGRFTHWLPLRLARSLAMRPLATDPSRDQPAMRTIVLGLGTVLLWYVVQFAAVSFWLGAVSAALWVVAIFLAARVDFLFSDRLRRAIARAQTFVALRRDPALQAYALNEMRALLVEAVALETALVGTRQDAVAS